MVNNAGIAKFGLFHKLTNKGIKDAIDVDLTHVTLMTSFFINKLLKRNARSAIINNSSLAGYAKGLAGDQIYNACKGYVHHFSQALSEEVKHKIDVHSLTPGFVATNIMPSVKKEDYKKIDPLHTSVEVCVAGCLKDLGFVNTSCGFWIHDL